jgi:hypothetical protein
MSNKVNSFHGKMFIFRDYTEDFLIAVTSHNDLFILEISYRVNDDFYSKIAR